MALFEDTLFGHEDKVAKAIQRLKTFEPRDGRGYYLAFSGGKDSQCIYHLAKMAGVKFDAHYSVTSVDPPELMRFIKEYYQDVEWERHYWSDGKPEHYHKDGTPKQITMWNLIADHTIPPTRQARYCCASLKETAGHGRVVVTGVRWAESVRRKALHGVADIQTKRKKLHQEALENPAYKENKNGGIVFMDDNEGARRMVEQCYAKQKTTINPIVDWTDEDVWEFLNDVAKVPHCSLYDEGYTRLGCIGCPLQGRAGMLADFERWPRYKELYIRAFDKMIKNHPGEIKVASGELVEDSSGGGGLRYTQDGSLGTPDGFDFESVQATDNQDRSYFVQVERERERENEQTRASGAVVAHGNGGGELCVLDKQLLTATHTHTAETVGRTQRGRVICPMDVDAQVAGTGTDLTGALAEQKSLTGGSGCKESLEDGAKNRIRYKRPNNRRGYNPDPRVADFENADEVMELWLDS